MQRKRKRLGTRTKESREGGGGTTSLTKKRLRVLRGLATLSVGESVPKQAESEIPGGSHRATYPQMKCGRWGDNGAECDAVRGEQRSSEKPSDKRRVPTTRTG